MPNSLKKGTSYKKLDELKSSTGNSEATQTFAITESPTTLELVAHRIGHVTRAKKLKLPRGRLDQGGRARPTESINHEGDAANDGLPPPPQVERGRKRIH